MDAAVKLKSSDDVEALQLMTLEAQFKRTQWLRSPILILGGVAIVMIVYRDQTAWRRWLLAALAGLTALPFVWGCIRSDQARFRRLASRSAWTLTALTSGAFCLATGAFDSPALPVLLVVCFSTGTFTSALNSLRQASLLSAIVIALAVISWTGSIPNVLPSVFGGTVHMLQSPVLLWAKATVLVLVLAWMAHIATTVRSVFLQMVRSAFDARDEVLKSHEAHARELTALSGELAHELKNPLANLKGLAVLVGRDVQAKGVERLEVLKGEIVRMEAILQEFLTFSRPLSPLTCEDTDVAALCRSVVALHEGLALEKGVGLKLHTSGRVRCPCDERKLRQILINLVQNALTASTAGSEIRIAVGSNERGGIRVEVLDRGPGIPRELDGHLFEPGATANERGTGLGLCLSRGLARQHGGDLALTNRDGGGCSAVLTLPGGSVQDAEHAT